MKELTESKKKQIRQFLDQFYQENKRVAPNLSDSTNPYDSHVERNKSSRR